MRAKLGLFCKERYKSKVKVSLLSEEQIEIESDLRHFQFAVGGSSDILRSECVQMRAKLGLFCKERYKSKVKVSLLSEEQIEIESDLRHFQFAVGGSSDILRSECVQMRAKLGLFCKERYKSKVKVSLLSEEQIEIESDLRHFQFAVGGSSDILRSECVQMRAKLGLFCKERYKSKVKVSLLSEEQIEIESDLRHFQFAVGGSSDILRSECVQMRAKLGLFCKERYKSKVKVSLLSEEQIEIESDLRHFQFAVGGSSDILRSECVQMRAKLGLFCKERYKSKVKVSLLSEEQIEIESDLRHFQFAVGGSSDILRSECVQMRAKLGLFCKERYKSKVKVSLLSEEQIEIESDLRHFQFAVGGSSDILRSECVQMRAKLGLFCKERYKSKVKVSLLSEEQIEIESDLRHFQFAVGGSSDILRSECVQMRAKLGLFCKERYKSKVKVSLLSEEQIEIESDLRHFQFAVGGSSDILRSECVQMRAKLGLFCKERYKSKVKVSLLSEEQIEIESDLRHFQFAVGGSSDILRSECVQMRAKLGLFCKERYKSKVKVSLLSEEQIEIESDLRHFQFAVGGSSDILRSECVQMRAKLGLFCKERYKSKVKVSLLSEEQIEIESDLRHFQFAVGGSSDILRSECVQMRAKLGLFCKERYKSKVKVSLLSEEQIEIESDLRHFQFAVGGSSDILRSECVQMRAKLGLFCKERYKSKVKVSLLSEEQIEIESDLRHFQFAVGGSSDILRSECVQMRAKLGLFCKERYKSKVKVSLLSEEQIEIESDLRHFQFAVGGSSDILRSECVQMRAKLGLFCKERYKSKVKVSLLSEEQIEIESDLRHFQFAVGGSSDILRSECVQMRAKLGLFCKERYKSKVKVSLLSEEQIEIESDLRHFQFAVGGSSDILRSECVQMRAKLGLFCKERYKSKVKVSLLSEEQIEIESDLRHFQFAVGGSSDILRSECVQMRAKLGLFCKERYKSKVKVSLLSEEQIEIESDLRHFQFAVGGSSDILRSECVQMRAKLGLFCKERYKSKVKVSLLSEEQIEIESDLRHFQFAVGGSSDILRSECVQMRAKLGLFCKERYKSKVKVSLLSEEQIEIESDLRHFQFAVGGSSDILRSECVQMRAKLGLFCKERYKSKVKVSLLSEEQIEIESDLRHFQFAVGGSSDILRSECVQMRAKLGLFCKERYKSKVKVSLLSEEQIEIESDLRHFQFAVGGSSDILRSECVQMRAKLGLFCKERYKSKVKVSLLSEEQIEIESDLRHFQFAVGGSSDILRSECVQMRAKLGLFCKERYKSKVKVSLLSEEQIEIESDLRHFQFAVGGSSDILRSECVQMRAKLGLFCKERYKSKVKVSLLSEEQIEIESDLRHFQFAVGGSSDILRSECVQMRAKLGLFCKERYKSKVKVSLLSEEQIEIESDLRHFQFAVGGSSDILRSECVQMRAKLGLFCKERYKSKVKVSLLSEEQIEIESDLRHFQFAVGGSSDILRSECVQMRAKLGLFCKERYKSKVKVSLLSEEQIEIESDLRHFQFAVGGSSDILRSECVQMRAKLGLFCKERYKSKVKVSLLSEEQIEIESDLRHFQFAVGGSSDILRSECVQMRAKLGLFCKERYKSKVKVSLLSEEQIEIESDLRHFQFAVGGSSDILRSECVQMRAKLGLFCKERYKSKVKVSLLSEEQIEIESDLRHFQFAVGGSSDILRSECVQMRAKLGLFCKERYKSKVKVSLLSEEQIEIESDLRHFQFAVGGSSDILRSECVQMRAKLGLFCKERYKSKVKVSLLSEEQIEIESDLRHFQFAVGGSSDILRSECVQMRAKLGLFCKERYKSKVKVSLLSEEQIEIESDLRHFQFAVGGSSDILRSECVQMRAKLGLFCKERYKSKVKVSLLSEEQIEIESDLRHFQFAVGGSSDILRSECVQMRAKLGLFCKERYKSKVKVSLLSEEQIEIESDLRHFQFAVGGSSDILRSECVQMRAKLGLFCKERYKSKVKVSLLSEEQIEIESDLRHFQFAVGGSSDILRSECVQMRAKLGLFCKERYKSKVKVSLLSEEQIEIESDLRHFQFAVGGSSDILRSECVQMRAKLGLFCKERYKSKVKVSLLSEEQIEIESDLRHFQFAVGGSSDILRSECVQMRAKLGLFCKERYKSKVKVSLLSEEQIEIESDLRHFQFAVGGSSDILRSECVQMRAKLGLFCKERYKSKVKVSLLSEEQIEIESDLRHFQFAVGGSSDILRSECVQMRAKLGLFCKERYKSKVKVSLLSEEQIEIESDLRHFQFAVGGSSDILRSECVQMRAKLGLFCKERYKSKVKVSLLSEEQIEIESDLRHFQFAVGGSSDILRSECVQMRAKLGLFCKERYKSKVKVSLLSEEQIEIESDLRHFQFAVGGSSDILRSECVQMRAKLGLFCKERYKSKVKVSLLSEEQIEIESDLRHFQFAVGGSSDILRSECVQMRAKLGLFCKERYKSKVKVSLLSEEQIEIESDLRHFQFAVGGSSDILRSECVQMRAKLGLFCKERYKSKVKVSLLSEEQIEIESDLRHFQFAVGGSSDILRSECVQMRAKLGLFCKERYKSKVKVSLLSEEQIEIESDLRHFQFAVGGSSDILRSECVQMRAKLGLFCKERYKSKVKVSLLSEEQIEIESDLRHFQFAVGGSSDILRSECVQMRAKLGLFCKERYKSKVKVSLLSEEQIEIESDLRHFQFAVGGSSDILRSECVQMRAKLGLFCKERYKSKVKVSLLSEEQIEIESDLRHFQFAVGGSSDILRSECVQMRAKLGLFCKERYKSKVKVSLLSEEQIEIESDLRHFVTKNVNFLLFVAIIRFVEL